MGHRPKVSPAIFIATILCFLFPFITVSCGGHKIATLSGVQLATGTSVSQPQMFGPPQKKDVAPEPLAAIVALCTIVGLALSFLPSSKMALGPAISGGVGALFLLLLKSKMDDQIVKQGQGMLQVNYEAGFTLSLLFLVAGAAWNGYLFFSQQAGTVAPSLPTTARSPGQPASPTASPPASAAVCPHCGASTREVSKFCASCGKPVSLS